MALPLKRRRMGMQSFCTGECGRHPVLCELLACSSGMAVPCALHFRLLSSAAKQRGSCEGQAKVSVHTGKVVHARKRLIATACCCQAAMKADHGFGKAVDLDADFKAALKWMADRTPEEVVSLHALSLRKSILAAGNGRARGNYGANRSKRVRYAQIWSLR